MTDKNEAAEYFENAKKFIEIHWFDEAIRATKEALRMAQFEKSSLDFNELYYTLAFIYFQKREFENALMYLNLIDCKSEMQDEAQILAQIIELKKGNLTNSKTKLEALLKNNKNNLNIISALGEIYFELQMYDKAIKIYENGLLLSPLSYDFLCGASLNYFYAHKIDKAFSAVQKFLSSYPCALEANVLIAKIYYAKNDFENAIQFLNKVKELELSYDFAYFLLGKIYNELNKADEAIKNLEIAIKLNPNCAKYYIEFAKSYASKNDFKSAFLYAKEANLLEEHNIEYIKCAILYAQKNNDKKSEKFYKSFL